MQSDVPHGWKKGHLAEVLKPAIRNVVVESTGIYRLLGVRWYCAGPRHHDTFAGSELKTTSLNLVCSGQVTYNKMWVKKGAFAVLGDSEHGLHATTEYPTFDTVEDKLDLQFMKFLMQTEMFQASAASLCKGTTSRARLNPNDFLKLELPLPPLAEQRKIAAILTSVDEAIQATEAVIAQTRRVKEGLLQELLTKGIGHTRFKQTEIGEIPETWEVRCMRDLGTVMAGKARNPNGPGVVRPYLRCANVFDDRVDIREVFEMPFTDDEFRRYELQDGDILLNEGQSLNLVGRPAVFQGEHPSCAFQNSLVRLRVNEKVATPIFAYQLVRHLYQTGGLAAVATQTTSIAHLGVSRFASIKVAVPPVEEQLRIQEPLANFDAINRSASTNFQKLQQLKSGLLQDLLTGRVRVTP
jgi:type I restriction enzyme S subunit